MAALIALKIINKTNGIAKALRYNLKFHLPLVDIYEENGLSLTILEAIYSAGIITMTCKSEKNSPNALFKTSYPPFVMWFTNSRPYTLMKISSTTIWNTNIAIKPIMNTIIGLYHRYFSNVLGRVMKSEIALSFMIIYNNNI